MLLSISMFFKIRLSFSNMSSQKWFLSKLFDIFFRKFFKFKTENDESYFILTTKKTIS